MTGDELSWTLFFWSYAVLFAGAIAASVSSLIGFIEWVDGEGPLFPLPHGFWQMGRWLGFSSVILGVTVQVSVF